MISAIVAVDNNWGIGYNGDLLEKIPEDMKYFKELTTQKPNEVSHGVREYVKVVMGRKTWDSLPNKPLTGRHNIIISSTIPETPQPQIIVNRQIPITFVNMDTIIKWFNVKTRFGIRNQKVFIIGGGQIYKELLPYCEKVYITKIYKDYENVDTYFPNLDEMTGWIATAVSPVKEYNNISYQFWEYDRIN